MISSAIIPQPLARLPWRLIWLVALICTIGIVTLFSAAGGHWSPWAMKQAVTILAFTIGAGAFGTAFGTLVAGVIGVISGIALDSVGSFAFGAFLTSAS